MTYDKGIIDEQLPKNSILITPRRAQLLLLLSVATKPVSYGYLRRKSGFGKSLCNSLIKVGLVQIVGRGPAGSLLALTDQGKAFVASATDPATKTVVEIANGI